MPPFPVSNIALPSALSFPCDPDLFATTRVNNSGEKIETLDEALSHLRDAQDKLAAQAQRIRQLETMAMTDELTGLMNRRSLMIALRREIGQSRRNKKQSGLLILIDLDGFKLINDLYGHAVGDAYLQSAASVLLNEVRTTDYVARLGGDEFAVILTNIAPKEAAQRLSRLEKAFNARVMHSHNLSLPLSASFGFSCLMETETPESAMVAADMKLYAHKAQRKKQAAEV